MTGTSAGAMTGVIADDLARVRYLRAFEPGEIALRYADRRRRSFLGTDGRLLLVAADHPARGALGVRDQPTAMANREDLLLRLITALRRPGVDGVLATADIIEDLLLLGVLDDKVVIGSMNRGGLQGASFEFDDRFTGYDAQGLADGRLDAGKMLCRICLDDPGSVATLESCGRAVSELARLGLTSLVEPFWSQRSGNRVVNDLSVDAVIRSIAVASGLGARSSHMWLKLPVIDRMDEVMAATTLPALLLGGDPTANPETTYASWARALAVPGVRGLVVGRTLLYPPGDDVGAAVDIAASLVHGSP